MAWNVELLLWILGLGLDKFSTFGGFGDSGAVCLAAVLAVAACGKGIVVAASTD